MRQTRPRDLVERGVGIDAERAFRLREFLGAIGVVSPPVRVQPRRAHRRRSLQPEDGIERVPIHVEGRPQQRALDEQKAASASPFFTDSPCERRTHGRMDDPLEVPLPDRICEGTLGERGAVNSTALVKDPGTEAFDERRVRRGARVVGRPCDAIEVDPRDARPV